MPPELKLVIAGLIYLLGTIAVALVYSYIIGCKTREHMENPYARSKEEVNDWRAAQIMISPTWPFSVPFILLCAALMYALYALIRVVQWLVKHTNVIRLFKTAESLGYKHGCGPKK